MSSDGVTEPQLLFDEMSMYYEEIRSINDRTLAYLKVLGVLAISLAAYMFFGLRMAATTDFATRSSLVNDFACHPISPLGAAGIAYSAIGIGLTSFLQFVCCYSLMQYGRSRIHKTRYWRSISILREKLHKENKILPLHGRAIPLQTGLEFTRRKNFAGRVPLPAIRSRDYNLGYFLAALSLAIFLVPCIFFATVWNYANTEYAGSLDEAFLFGIVTVAPFGAIVAFALFCVALDMCWKLKGAQFATDRMFDPTVEERKVSRKGKIALILLRVAVYGWLVCYTIRVIYSSLGRVPDAMPIYSEAILTVVAVLLERFVTTIVKQYSLPQMFKRALEAVLRFFTRREEALATMVLPKVAMRQIKPRGDVDRIIWSVEDGKWRCVQRYRPELAAEESSLRKALHKLSHAFDGDEMQQEKADAIEAMKRFHRRARHITVTKNESQVMCQHSGFASLVGIGQDKIEALRGLREKLSGKFVAQEDLKFYCDWNGVVL